ncbi:probable glucan endo-1,3-beta-glucosidase BG4 [Eucalyptus grandis]|uniref:probable glucan endo-1,3-beta-glucosidase BG4 n=1 Tax=Eucalyptus grandis TaxID=71139 RepID=UPI0005255DA9|nr:probable glucan endo-1,3-beta-glucosidase BG4 [Eucalyptus grandis]
MTTVVSQSMLALTCPPSVSNWNAHATPFLLPLAPVSATNNNPLLCNIYPYFAYHDSPAHVLLDYAPVNKAEVVVMDGAFGYTNLFDVSIDGFYWALEKVGGVNMAVVTSETRAVGRVGRDGCIVELLDL